MNSTDSSERTWKIDLQPPLRFSAIEAVRPTGSQRARRFRLRALVLLINLFRASNFPNGR